MFVGDTRQRPELGSALSLVLLGIVVLEICLSNLVKRHLRKETGNMNQHTPPKAIWKTIVAVFLLMPLVISIVYAFSARWVHILPEGLHPLHRRPLTNQKFLLGIGRGLLISFLPVVITNVSVLLALYDGHRLPAGLERWCSCSA